MWFLSSWVLTLGLFAVTDSRQNEVNCSSKSCTIKNEHVVCGSDGVTYPSSCHLERAKCKNTNLTLVHQGVCPEFRPCFQALAASSKSNGFLPKCRRDGNYASAQCHQDAGYCWCVTPKGTPISRTSVKWTPNTKPRCSHKKKTKRRSSTRSRKSRKVCKRADRALFNSNLIKIFHTEYVREHGSSVTASGTDCDRTVLEWQFKRLDRNQNNVLDKTEYRDLRKIVKKAVKPKRCAKSFARECDMNRDQFISNQEWSNCLTRDGMDDGHGEDDVNRDEDEEDEEEGEDIFASPRSPPHGVLYGGGRLSSGQNYEDESGERREEDSTDCISDRQMALGEQRADKNDELYVPECTPDGRYKKVQCYKSAGYCWCVNEDTGKNIPGTSVKNQMPKCDQIITPSRPMKGCPDEKKITFLKDLLDYLHQLMVKETNGTSISGNGAMWKVPKEEQVANWSFVIFDKNKNKVLDRSEWKTFKDLMSTIKNLKRCGKKLPRYCDINKDRQISMTEWLDCLNMQRYMVNNVATTVSTGLVRTGKNPLSMLIDD